MNYFAYGSNMLAARLRARVGAVRGAAVASLPGYGLRFHKRSSDGSGKADAFKTRDGDVVWGVVFELTEAQFAALDKYEGRGKGYERVELTVFGRDGAQLQAQVYLAAAQAIDPLLRPSREYLGWMVTGARERGLPRDYVAEIEKVATTRRRDAREPV